MNGIDVSKWQGEIDWQSVKAAGVEFAIIKAGGSDGGFYKDPYFERNYEGARSVGIPTGAYYYVGPYFGGAAAGRGDAARFAEYLSGKRFEFPVYLNCEVVARYITKEQCTEAATAFCEYLEENGYFAGIYGAEIAVFRDILGDVSRFTAWVARYGQRPDIRCAMWQMTNMGTVPGINGRVDLDECYVDFPEIIKSRGLNGFTQPTVQELKEIIAELENALERLKRLNIG